MDELNRKPIALIWDPMSRMGRMAVHCSGRRLVAAAAEGMIALAMCWVGTVAVQAQEEIFPVMRAEPIMVRVVDGKDGKPVSLAHVVLVGGYEERDLDVRQWRQEALTDRAGAVQLRDGLRNLPLVRVEVVKGHGCAADGFEAAFLVDLVRRDGITGPNRCGAVLVASAPGVLTVFVKGKKAGAKSEIGTTQNLKAELAEAEVKKPTGPEWAEENRPAPQLTEAQTKEVGAAFMRAWGQK